MMDSRASWAVAAACCLTNCLLYGVARLSGLLMVASVHAFRVSRARAALPFALSSALRNLSGVFVGHLGRRWGVRAVVCAGTALASLGAGLCFFAQDIFWVTVCWGGLFGIGYGLGTCLLPLAINQHFVKHCATASGISYSGSYIGSFIFPPLVVILLRNYGLPGTFLIISGTVLNVLAASMFFGDPARGKTAKGSGNSDPWWRRLRTHQMTTPAVVTPSVCLTSSVTLHEDSGHHVTGFRDKSGSFLPNHVPKSHLVSQNSLSKGKSRSKYVAKLNKLKQVVSVSLFRQKHAWKLDLPSIQDDNIKLVSFRNFHCILCPCVPHSHQHCPNQTLNNNDVDAGGTKNELLDFYGNTVRLMGDRRRNLTAISHKPGGCLKNIEDVKVLNGIRASKDLSSHRTCGVRNGQSILPVSFQSSGMYPSAKSIMDHKPCEPLALSASTKLFLDNKSCKQYGLSKSTKSFSSREHCQASDQSNKLLSDHKSCQASNVSLPTKLLSDHELCRTSSLSTSTKLILDSKSCEQYDLSKSTKPFSGHEHCQMSDLYKSSKLFSDRKPCRTSNVFTPLSDRELCRTSGLSTSAKLILDNKSFKKYDLSASTKPFSGYEHCQMPDVYKSSKPLSDHELCRTSGPSTSARLLMDRKRRLGAKKSPLLVRKTRSFCAEWVRLLGMPMFVVISLTMSLYTFVMVCLITIIEDYAKDLQIPESDVHYVLMVLSIADLVGTLTLGVITDRGYMSRRHFIAFCFLGMGVCSASLSLCRGSGSLLCCVVCYGLFESGTVITFPVLMGDCVPPAAQAVAIASSNVLSAPAPLLVPIVIGHFRDRIGCYSGVFYLLGVTSMLCAGLWLMVPLIHRAWRKEGPARGPQRKNTLAGK